MSRSIPLSLYVHFPWCIRKCPYCDFNSHPQKGPIPEARYVERLLLDFAYDAHLCENRAIDTVFLGGGTPSLFSGAAIGRLLAGLRERAQFADDVEITLEANPGAIDAAHFAAYRDAGVNRISIGAQTFDANALERLGRIHAPDDIERAVATARSVGFTRINLDLMHGLPGQDVAGARADLERAISLGVDHVSWYQLTIEPRTIFAAHPPRLPDEEALASIEIVGLDLLWRARLDRYEISAFARPEQRARHNVNYWTFGDYLGIGAGAHGKVSRRRDGLSVTRTEKPKAPERYLSTDLAELRRETPVPASALPGEFLLNALRLVEGVAFETFEARTGLPIGTVEVARARLVARGLLEGDRLAVTELGRRYLDSVIAEFV